MSGFVSLPSYICYYEFESSYYDTSNISPFDQDRFGCLRSCASVYILGLLSLFWDFDEHFCLSMNMGASLTL